MNGEKRNAYWILVGKPEGKKPLGRPRCSWVHNIKMDLRETGWDGTDWIDLAQDRDQWSALVTMVAAQLVASQEGLSFMKLRVIGLTVTTTKILGSMFL
jgi:hypothetical protein